MRITRFIGGLPATSKRHAGDGVASETLNARLTDGSLRAMRRPKMVSECEQVLVATLPQPRCLPHAVVPTGLVVGEAGVYAENGELRYYPDESPVFLPKPDRPLVVAGRVTGGRAGKLMSFRVSSIGENGNESPLSDPSDLTEIDPGKVVRLNTTGFVRVYASHATTLTGDRENPSDAMAAWVVVGDFESPAAFRIDVKSWALSGTGGNPDDWCQPNPVESVIRLDSGHFVLKSGRRLFVSERHLEYAYPIRGAVELEVDIKLVVPVTNEPAAIVITETLIFMLRVLTDQAGLITPDIQPYTATHGLYGTVDAVSKTPFGVVYPAREGLVFLSAGDKNEYQVITGSIIPIDEWQRMTPKAGAWHNGRYVCDKWVLDAPDPQNGRNELQTLTPHSFGGDAFYPTHDGRLLQRIGNEIYEWGAGDYAEAVFTSRTFVAKGPSVFTCFKVVGENLSGVRVRLLDDDTGATLMSETLQDSDNNRPINFKPARLTHGRIQITLPESRKEIAIYEVHFAGNRYALA